MFLKFTLIVGKKAHISLAGDILAINPQLAPQLFIGITFDAAPQCSSLIPRSTTSVDMRPASSLIVCLAGVAAGQLAGGPTFNDFLRFSCSELNIQRIDP